MVIETCQNKCLLTWPLKLHAVGILCDPETDSEVGSVFTDVLYVECTDWKTMFYLTPVFFLLQYNQSYTCLLWHK